MYMVYYVENVIDVAVKDNWHNLIMLTLKYPNSLPQENENNCKSDLFQES